MPSTHPGALLALHLAARCSHQAALSDLQEIVDDALTITSKSGYDVPEVCVFNHSQAQPQSEVAMQEGRDVWWQDVVAKQEPTCEVEWLEAEEPLFKVSARLHKGAGIGRGLDVLGKHAALCNNMWAAARLQDGVVRGCPASKRVEHFTYRHKVEQGLPSTLGLYDVLDAL